MAKKKFDWEVAFETIPEEPKGFKEYCYRMMPLPAIYYKRKHKIAECICGNCGKFFVTTDIPIRKDTTTCPLCGNIGYWEWQRITYKSYFGSSVGLIQCTTDGNLVIRSYYVSQEYMQGQAADRKIVETKRCFLRLGDVHTVNNGYAYTKNGYRRQWKEIESKVSDIAAIYPGWKIAVKKSALKYCDVEMLCGKPICTEEIINALKTYANNPAIEMYAKAGMGKLVWFLLQKQGKTQYVNRRGKSIKAQLKIDSKERINNLIEHEGRIDYLKVYQREKKKGLKYTEQQIDFLAKIQGFYKGETNAEYLLQYMSIQKLINRIEKYKSQEGGYKYTNATLSAYHDYLRMREELGYDMTNEVFIYPNNLKEKHDQMVREKNERANELHMAKMQEKYSQIAERYETLCKRYCFEKDGYCICPAKNAAEIVAEGRSLHHCVGRDTYLKRHAEGESFILFLRKQETPDIPYYTIEIRKNEIVQWYGVKDTKPDKEIIEPWLKEYMEFLEKRKKQSEPLKVAV